MKRKMKYMTDPFAAMLTRVFLLEKSITRSKEEILLSAPTSFE